MRYLDNDAFSEKFYYRKKMRDFFLIKIVR